MMVEPANRPLTADSRMHEGPGIPVHPPVLYLAALLIGVGLDYLWPLRLVSGRWGVVAGIVLIAAGIAIMPPVLGRFRRAGTTFDVRKPASALIVDGPYRFSRNPAYIALTLWYLGIGLILGRAWVLLLLAPLLVVMDRLIVPREERHLKARFGEQYVRYKAAVRRWL